MTLQSSNAMLAYTLIRGSAANWKIQAQNANITLGGSSVSSEFIFRLLDQLSAAVIALNTWKNVAGLNAYATGQGYTGTMLTDCTATAAAAQACIDWVVANFPNSGGFLQAQTLNADGSRTLRTFTPAQTAGLQTTMTSFVATIS